MVVSEGNVSNRSMQTRGVLWEGQSQ